MNPRNTTSSFSKREKIRRNPFSGPHFGLDVGLANRLSSPDRASSSSSTVSRYATFVGGTSATGKHYNASAR